MVLAEILLLQIMHKYANSTIADALLHSSSYVILFEAIQEPKLLEYKQECHKTVWIERYRV